MVEPLPFERPFTPSSLRWRLADAIEEGPAPFGLPSVDVGVDGGGWWVAELGGMQAGNPQHHRALRALALRLRGGRVIDVPFVEQAATGGLTTASPFSDGSRFSDGTGLIGSRCEAELHEPVKLRDDTALIRITTGHLLTGGDMFSLNRGVVLGSELHGTDSVEDLGDNLWRVTLGPQFRMAHDAGTPVNFNDPHCAMTLKDRDGGMWPTFGRGWIGRASARFEEAL